MAGMIPSRRESLKKASHSFVIIDRNIFNVAHISGAWHVPGRQKDNLSRWQWSKPGGLAVFILKEVAFKAVKDSFLAIAHRGCVVAKLRAAA